MICITCKREKPVTAFWRNSHKRCKTCESQRRVKYQRRINLRSKYGMSEVEYEALLEQQGGVCGICGGVNTIHPLCVDHNHKTGKVRGLLCHKCNRGIGLLQDDTTLLQKAILWMETH